LKFLCANQSKEANCKLSSVFGHVYFYTLNVVKCKFKNKESETLTQKFLVICKSRGCTLWTGFKSIWKCFWGALISNIQLDYANLFVKSHNFQRKKVLMTSSKQMTFIWQIFTIFWQRNWEKMNFFLVQIWQILLYLRIQFHQNFNIRKMRNKLVQSPNSPKSCPTEAN